MTRRRGARKDPARVIWLSMKVRTGSSFDTPFGSIAKDFGLKGCVGVVVAFDTEADARAFDPTAEVGAVYVPPVERERGRRGSPTATELLNDGKVGDRA